MPDESTDVIEQQMQETRDSLTQKVTALEDSVVGNLQSASETVHNIIDSVKTVVPDALADVKDQMKSTLDVSKHTREKPWGMVGGAVAVGFITGLILFRKREQKAPRPLTSFVPPVDAPSTPSKPAKLPAWLEQIVDRLTDKVGDEVRKLGDVALASASSALQQTVEQAIPKLLGNAMGETDTANTMPHGAHRNGYHATPASY